MPKLDSAQREALKQHMQRLSAACTKERHALLRAAVAHAMKYVTDEAEGEDEVFANALFFPLKVGLELPKEESSLLCLQPLQHLLALGVVGATHVFKPPEVAVPTRKSPNPPTKEDPSKGNGEPPLIMAIVLALLRVKALSTVEEVQLLALKTLLIAVTTESLAVHGKPLLEVLETMYEVYLNSKNVSAQSSAKSSLSHLIGAVQQRVEETESLSGGDVDDPLAGSQVRRGSQLETPSDTSLTPVDAEDAVTNSIDFRSPSERDCFMIVRSLSKLASRPSEGEGVKLTPQQMEITTNSQLLSLTLLHHFLVNVGTSYGKAQSFRYALRKYICRSLVLNCASAHVETARAALEMLVTLMVDYRAVLKKEIAVMFVHVLFPVLHSTNASFGLRSAIWGAVEMLLRRPAVAMDLFINYDCGVGWPDVVQPLVHLAIREVHTNHMVPNWITARQDELLRSGALAALVGLMRSLVEWATVERRGGGEERESTAADDGGGGASLDSGGEAAESEGTGSPLWKAEGSECSRMLRDKKSLEGVLTTFRNQGVKDGLQAAIEVGLLRDMTPQSIAKFFFDTRELDKVRVGEFLAPDKPLNRETLKCYVEMHSFEGKDLDDAIRHFLGKFKMVGEAQTVDRTMERLASWYCEQNPQAFSNSGVAYVLSFSIMMLNTDAHSSHVKNKMSLQEFIRNNRGIDDGKDLSTDYLTDVYNRIVQNEIVLEGTPKKSTRKEPTVAEDDPLFSLEKKQELRYKRESDSLVRDVTTRLDEEPSLHQPALAFQTAKGIDVAAALWAILSGPILPALSASLTTAADDKIVDVCLDGFAVAIHLTTLIETPTERSMFFTSLCGFTHLNNINEITPRNIRSIQTLIQVTEANGNYLGGLWYDVLKCISQLDGMHTLINSKDNHLSHWKRHEFHNAEVVSSQISQAMIDRIFSKSAALSGEAVIAMVECFCRVSAEELQEKPPRTFSLQKLLEVTDCNISRLRYVWSKMWVHLSRHFIRAGLSETQAVARFVVIHLKQLAKRFLARRELGNFHFQRDVLRPFEVIAVNARDSDLRTDIVDSIGVLVAEHHENILSGWRTVLFALARCAGDLSFSVVQAACGRLQHITRHYARHFATAEGFCDVVMAWSLVAATPVSAVGESAIFHLELLGWMLRYGVPATAPSVVAEKNGEFKPFTFDDLKALTAELESAPEGSLLPIVATPQARSNAWMSLYASIGSLIGVRVVDTPQRALNALIGTLLQHGDILTDAEWMLALEGAMFPVFLNVFSSVDLGVSDRVDSAILEMACDGLVLLIRKHHRLLTQYASLVELLLQGPACGVGWASRPTLVAVEALTLMNGPAERWAVLTTSVRELLVDLRSHVMELEGAEARSRVITIVSSVMDMMGNLVHDALPQDVVVEMFGIVGEGFQFASRIALGCVDDPSVTVGILRATAAVAMSLIERIGPSPATHKWVDVVFQLFAKVGNGEITSIPKPVVQTAEEVATTVLHFVDRRALWWQYHYQQIVRLVEVESVRFRATLAEGLSHHPPAPRDSVDSLAASDLEKSPS